jgi:peptidyl-prolyl cis-trans isomerase A (cyclophilin A)
MKAWLGLGAAFFSSLLVSSVQSPGRAAETDKPQVVLETSMGDITLELEPERAPITVDNFLKYVRSGFYDGTIFHRVIENFMIQGGGYTKDKNLKTPLYPPIKLESRNGLKNVRGTIAAARTKAPDSATSQFFINVVDNPFLDYSERTNPTGYAVFGRVIKGLDVVDRIRTVKVTENPFDIQQDGTPAASLPATPVVILSARIEAGAEGPGGR